MKPIIVIDEPCGTGKTSRMIERLHPSEKYLIVVPYLSEVRRIINDAQQIELKEPLENQVFERTKHAHLGQLLEHGHSVVTTHSSYANAVPFIRAGILKDYNIIVDEVLDAATLVATKSYRSVQDLYLKTGYLESPIADELKPQIIGTNILTK